MRRTAAIAILLALALQIPLASCTATEKDSEVEPNTTPTTTPAAVPTPVGEPRRGGEVVITVGSGTPRSLSSAVASGIPTFSISAQIFASPLRYDEKWNPQPYLAESWEVSEDGLAVTLHLVQGATFHDGQPITSEDVAFSVMTVKTYHPFQSMFAPVERVDTPDHHTAVIRLSRPHPAILLAMSPALLPIIPKHVYGDGQDLPTHPANFAPIGSGPFRFVEYVPGESVVLERNEDYFIPGRPYLDQVVFRIESDPNAQMIELERQEAHLMANFPDPAELSRLGASKHLAVTDLGYKGTGALNWLAFNLLREPLSDKRVRQAIAYAVDRGFITAYLHQGKSRVATGPIAPDSPFYEANVWKYEVDLEKANSLLDEAGYPSGSDGTRFALTLDYAPAYPNHQEVIAFYLRRQLVSNDN